VKKAIGVVSFLTIGAVALVSAASDPVIHGTVKKVDEAAKTVTIATANGSEEVVHFTDKTVVHGTAAGSKDALHGLKVGSEVAVHGTTVGATKTAVEVDDIGKDGLKATEGTVSKIGAGGKDVVIKTADGTEQSFEVTGDAAADLGKATAKGTKKSGKVTCYYTEEGGKKVAHFFKKI
jgi:Cu/Ag efflux protein CusF